MIIYTDNAKRLPAGQHLHENILYYIDFEEASPNTVSNEISKSKLSRFISWQNGNRYATLKITNFIGNVYFFNHTYDIRSQKFLQESKGTDQFQIILDEIQKLSKNVIFTYHSPSFSLRQVDFSDLAPSLLLMFNYFKNIILNWPVSSNLKTEFERISRNPHFKYDIDYKKDKIEKLKKVNHKVLKSLISDNKEFVMLTEADNHLWNLPIVNFISQNSPNRYFPTKVLMHKKYLSYDTDENRFIKFFFGYIEEIAFRVGRLQGLTKEVRTEKDKILAFTRSILQQPFFDDIGPIRNIPANSPVLQNRAGYKDIFSHYTQSRFGIKHIFDDFAQQAMSVDLKRISEIYEYWVFYKIALALLGEDITVEQQEAVLKNGELSYSVCFKHENVKVYYNWTASRAKRTAYAVQLRPDVAVCIETPEKTINLLFDAKYKVDPKTKSDQTIEYNVKSEDIQKMHTYLDAIKNSEFAIVVYPGSEFIFYEKDLSQSIKTNINSIRELQGVGAIPLVPGNTILEQQFNNLIEFIKTKYIQGI